MNIDQSASVRIPFRLVDGSGAPVTGVVVTDILNSQAVFVKSDGTIATISLVLNTNFFEVSSANAPGLYHVLVPSTATGTLGPSQLAIYPSATKFVSQVFTDFIVTALVPNVASALSQIGTVITTLGTPAHSSVSGDIANVLSTVTPILNTLQGVAIGKWLVQGTQLFLYDTSNNLIKSFNLLDDLGQPSSSRIFQRSPI